MTDIWCFNWFAMPVSLKLAHTNYQGKFRSPELYNWQSLVYKPVLRHWKEYYPDVVIGSYRFVFRMTDERCRREICIVQFLSSVSFALTTCAAHRLTPAQMKTTQHFKLAPNNKLYISYLHILNRINILLKISLAFFLIKYRYGEMWDGI